MWIDLSKFLFAFFSSISHTEGPLYEVADVKGHLQLFDMVQHMFPDFDEKNWDFVYQTIIECMAYKKHV